MLAIPLMKSGDAVGQFDLTPFSTYLKNQRCYDEGLLDTDLIRFQSLRVQVASIVEPADVNHQLLLTYVNQLFSLIPRIPSNVMDQEIRQPFHWFDAFQATKRNSFTSFQFEAAAVIWNLGALESLKGGRLDRSSDEGIRMAAKSFQYAAGCFDYILNNILPAFPPNISSNCPCFSSECLNLVKSLMLAQAQLCFYEKAVRDKKKDMMKSAIIAKLASQVSMFYSQACASTKVGGIVQILDISWFAITDFQSKSFQAAKEYWQGVASKEAASQKGSGYGEEVARYIRAEQHIRQAMEVSKKFNLQGALQGGADSLLQAITTNRTQALHDLNAIYMEAVTPDHSLSDIPPVSMVKATPFHAGGSSDGGAPVDDVMFKYILPREFIAVMRRFYDEVASTFKKNQDQVIDATNLGRMTLSSVGLPASIEACKSSGAGDVELPDALWQRIQEVQSSRGGVALLRDSYEQIVRASRRAQQTIQTVEECLVDAEKKDDQFRIRFPSYSGQRASEMNMEIRGNLAKFQHALQTAQPNDELLRLEIFSESMNQLGLSRADLNRVFQQAVSASSSPAAPTVTVVNHQTMDLLDLLEDDGPATVTIVAAAPTSNAAPGYSFSSPEMLQLEEKLHDLAALFESRQQDLDRLKQLGAIDLSKELTGSLNGAASVNADAHAQQVYQKYATDMQQLDATIAQRLAQQDVLVAEIVRLNEIFVKQREADPILKAKNQVVLGLEQAVGKFAALHSQLTAGQTFYSNLQTQLTTLQQNADDNAYQAQWQRQEFEASVSTKATPATAVNTTLANQFASSVHVTPTATPAAYSAYPSFNSTPAATATPVTTAYTPTVTSPVTHAAPTQYSPAPATVQPTSGYQYNQNSYSVLAQPAATTPAPAPQYQQQYQPQPVNMYAQPAPQLSPYPGAVVGQPTTAPPGYGTYPGQQPAAAPTPPARPPRPLTTQEIEAKISRVAEMGFPRDQVSNALMATNWNEDAALNILLGVAPQPAPQGTPMHPPGAVPAAAAPPAAPAAGQPTQQHKSGLFSGFWGKK